MKTIFGKIDAAYLDTAIIERAAALIKKGEVVVCPTDTGYAFCANAMNVRAIAKVFQLKGRSFNNPIHIAVASITEAEKYAVVSEAAKTLAKRYLPGGLTMVMQKKDTIPSILVAGMKTVGIRIPDNTVILRLAELTGLPLTTTSANISGQPGTYAVAEIQEQLGENMKKIAMVLDQGTIKQREVSTIVDLNANPPELIRQGKVSWLDIRTTLKQFQGITNR
jgi:L-threonylcarbamoyladenylate synthase